MPFNLQAFYQRAISGIFFVLIMLAGLLWSPWTFLLLFSIIHFGCWIEYQKLAGFIDPEYKKISPLHKYGVMIAGWAFMISMTGSAYEIAGFSLHDTGVILLLTAGVILPLALVFLTKSFSVKTLVYSLIGLLYISLSFGLLISIRNFGLIAPGIPVLIDTGWIIPIILIGAIWINDTMAYVVGSFIGKTPFSKISPKKTWEGTAGGAVLCVAIISLGGYYLFNIKDITTLVVISVIAAVAGTAGDLFESKLKRLAGVKDSGQIMPGHGGFLDRFDSLIFATPFVWLYMLLFGM